MQRHNVHLTGGSIRVDKIRMEYAKQRLPSVAHPTPLRLHDARVAAEALAHMAARAPHRHVVVDVKLLIVVPELQARALLTHCVGIEQRILPTEIFFLSIAAAADLSSIRLEQP